jgi:hypothetical protein
VTRRKHIRRGAHEVVDQGDDTREDLTRCSRSCGPERPEASGSGKALTRTRLESEVGAHDEEEIDGSGRGSPPLRRGRGLHDTVRYPDCNWGGSSWIRGRHRKRTKRRRWSTYEDQPVRAEPAARRSSRADGADLRSRGGRGQGRPIAAHAEVGRGPVGGTSTVSRGRRRWRKQMVAPTGEREETLV